MLSRPGVQPLVEPLVEPRLPQRAAELVALLVEGALPLQRVVLAVLVAVQLDVRELALARYQPVRPVPVRLLCKRGAG